MREVRKERRVTLILPVITRTPWNRSFTPLSCPTGIDCIFGYCLHETVRRTHDEPAETSRGGYLHDSRAAGHD